MKTIIAGCRDFKDYNLLKSKVDAYREDHVITEVVCGGATGADALGENYAVQNGITVKGFPADWNKHGKAAGPIRNRQMAEYADCLIAVWDGKSRGTKNMIDEMNKLMKPVFLIWIGEPVEAQGATKFFN
jgi:hypothetical protein